MATPREVIEGILNKADVKIGGERPGDIVVHDERAYARILSGGSLALGESYMDGWWDVKELDVFFDKLMRAGLVVAIIPFSHILAIVKAQIFNMQSRARAFQVAYEHYDLGNDLYQKMLDSRMVYTCAYWTGTPRAQNLEEAQEAKLDLVCRKLRLKKGDRVLDIGCGWGSFAKYAAENYGASVVGITVSKEQLALAQERVKGLSVELRLQDYREVNEEFDHIVSIEMFEAVGYKNFREYFEVATRCLKKGGLFVLQTIGTQASVKAGDPWIDKYIFPNGVLPSLMQIGDGIKDLLIVEDAHNFGADYDPTLMAWFKNFDAAWPELQAKYGDRFYRMWKYYLLQCAGMFRSRFLYDWQFVFSKGGVPGGYISVR